MKKTLILMVLCVFSASIVFGQQEILMKSGRKITAYKVKLDDKQGIVFYKNKKGKIKWESMSDVFSLTREDSVHIIFYKPDCEDVCFKIDQMADFLNGFAAGKEESAIFPLITGVVVGGGSSFFIVKAGLSVLAPMPSVGNSILFGGIRPNPDNFDIPEKYKDNAHYKEGLVQSLKRKRATWSIIGGGIGIMTGVLGANLMK